MTKPKHRRTPLDMTRLRNRFAPANTDLKAQDALGQQYHFALKTMQLGYGDAETYHTLVAASLLSSELCRVGVGAGYLPAVAEAQNSLDECVARHRRLGKWGMNGGEMKTLMRLCSVLDEQHSQAGAGVVPRAIREVQRAVSAAERA